MNSAASCSEAEPAAAAFLETQPVRSRPLQSHHLKKGSYWTSGMTVTPALYASGGAPVSMAEDDDESIMMKVGIANGGASRNLLFRTSFLVPGASVLAVLQCNYHHLVPQRIASVSTIYW